MAKKVDINGFWDIKNNPLTKEGVFAYLGSQVDPKGNRWGLDQKRIYWVYRPLSEIAKEETIKSFDGVPFIDEHDMLGEGCTPTDCKNIAGTIYNVHMDGNKMVADFKIYSDGIKREIRNGKKQLSLGYRASFEKKAGIFDGKSYDFVQVGIMGNHVALVNRGRCGSDVRIFDKSVVCDSLEVPQMKIDKEALKSILDGMDEETLIKAKEVLEKMTASNVEDESVEDESKKDESKENETKEVKDEKICQKCGKMPCVCEDKKCEDKKEECKDEKNDEVTKSEVVDESLKTENAAIMDEATIKANAIKDYREAIALHDKLVPHIGEFVMDGMDTPQQVAEYGCKKLNLNVNAGSEIATLTGFLAGSKGKTEKIATVDEAVKTVRKQFNFKDAYLANK